MQSSAPDWRAMSIEILSDASFPWGMAAAARVRCLAKGMMAEGLDVTYIGLRGADVSPDASTAIRGRQHGIPYVYPGGFSIRPRSWIGRRLDDVTATAACMARFLYRRLLGRLDAVVIYSRQTGRVLLWMRFLHLLRVPVVLELCEWPLAIARTQGRPLRQAERYCHTAIPKADAVLPISTYIEREVARLGELHDRAIPSFRIPILLDHDPPSRQDTVSEAHEPYLLYIGSISYFDIATTVVDIVASLTRRGIRIPVKLTGGGPREAFDRLRAYARDRAVEDLLVLTGHIDDAALIALMQGATALLAPMPDDLQSIARMPTKLGFYLASGRPVVTTAVGDIPRYLENRSHAYIADKYDPDMLADRVADIISDPETAAAVAQNGRRRAAESFHYACACAGLGAFMRSLVKEGGH